MVKHKMVDVLPPRNSLVTFTAYVLAVRLRLQVFIYWTSVILHETQNVTSKTNTKNSDSQE